VSVQDFILATIAPIFTGWSSYNTRQIDQVKRDAATDRASVAAIKQKVEDTYDLVKEVREDQKRRNGNGTT